MFSIDIVLIYSEKTICIKTQGFSMLQYYMDYVWKNGSPRGSKPCTEEEIKKNTTYKIVADPYYKRISIEKYEIENFTEVVYDSALFDFRHLKLGEQLAWQKIPIHETENTAISHIRNQDDRLILIEKYRFDSGLCKECHTFSPFGPLVSIQKIFYKKLKDPFNGVTLFDSNNRLVMAKYYEFDESSNAFSQLIKEEWLMPKQPT